jgi:molecular chaperone GrpE
MKSAEEDRNPDETLDEIDEVEALKEDLERAQQTYLRAMADFDNYRKRVERDRAVAIKAGKTDLVLQLLDVVDNFERALKHMEGASSAINRGIKAIYRQLLRMLEAQGITSFNSLHLKFDPALHEAVGSVESKRYPADTVVEEISRGYRWGSELLRPAKVVIAK